MQRQLETFNKLEDLSKTLFGSFNHIGGSNKVPEYNKVTAPNSQGAELIDSAKSIFNGSLKAIDSFIPNSIIADYFNPDLVNGEWSDIAPNLVNNINQSGELVSNAVKDPEVRKALKKAIAVYGEALKTVYGMAEPTVTELTDKFWLTINDIGVKSARGATNATIDTVAAAVAEIPVAGGLVDIFIAGGKWFNAIASGFIAPAITSSGDVTGKAIYTGRQGIAFGEKYGPELSESASDLKNAISNVSNNTQQSTSSNTGASASASATSSKPSSSNVSERMNETNSVGNATGQGQGKAMMNQGIEQGKAMLSQGMSQGKAMLNQAKTSNYGKAAMATGDYGKQLGKTGLRSAKLGMAVADGNYLTAAKHSAGLGWDSAKLGYKGISAARAVNKASKGQKKGGHSTPFMFGGKKDKRKTLKAANTSSRVLRTIKRFTQKKR